MESKEIQNWEEDSIDLVHMAVYILKKWRILLVAILVGGLLGGAWQLLPKEQPQAMQTTDTVEFTEDMRMAAMYRRQYADQKAYVENSTLMEMDSNHVIRGEMEYYISECREPELVASHFKSLLKDSTVRSALCEALQLTDETDLDYLVKCKANSAGDVSPTTEAKLTQQKGSAEFDFSVRASSEEQAEKALAVLEEGIIQMYGTVKQKIPFKLVEVFRGVYSGDSDTLKNIQKTTLKGMYDCLNYYTGFEKEFTENEKKVYERYLLSGEIVVPVEEQLAPEANAFSLKKTIVAAVVGAFVICAWFAVKYLLNTMVKTADDVKVITRRNVIGMIHQETTRKRGIDGWMDQLETKTYPNGISLAYAAVAVKKLGNVVLVCDTENEELSKAAADIGGGTIVLDLISKNAESLNKIDEGMQIVLLVKLGETSKDQLRCETALYSQYGLTLAGTLLLE